jgi:hypothetical protein
MDMAARYPHAARDRDDRAHGVIQDAIDKGYMDSGRPYIVPGLPSHEVANQTRQSITRGLHHFGVAPAAWVTDADGNQCGKACQAPDAPHGAGFELHSKNAARKYIVQQTGGDPAKLKFNPFAPPRPGRFDDDGQWIPGT